MNDPSEFPASIRARVHDGAIDRVTRFFNATLADAFVELARLPQLGGHKGANPLIFSDRTPKGRHYTPPNGRAARAPSDGDPRRGLLRQGHAELVQQKLELLVRSGMARQDEVPAVGGRQVDIHHLDGGERLDDGARGEA